MSFAKIYTRGVLGLHAPLIDVEVHVSQGLPALTIVGLPDAAVRESKDRVRSAIINSGFTFPTKRLTINLAPANLPKDSTHLDLPIAIGILVASGQLNVENLQAYEFFGELALDGHLRPIHSTLAVALACEQAQRKMILPVDNASEATQIQALCVLPANSLKTVCDHLLHHQVISPAQLKITKNTHFSHLDLSDIKGQIRPKRALEIAAAGGHSLLFRGPPGTGKTLLASRLNTILPDTTQQHALEIASIHSIAQQPYVFGERPFRAVHHTTSAVALVGGGSRPKPGEITLAHLGVLFLDELPEFDRKVLEVLRQPLESQNITVSRAAHQVTFPANFQLVAAMNPCPCGYAFNQDNRCECSVERIKRYQNKISGPLLDRIDLHIDVPMLSSQDLQNPIPAQSSSIIKQRVTQAYNIQIQRQGCTNQALSLGQLQKYAFLEPATQKMLTMAQEKLNLSARAYHRVLKVARTIADLDQSDEISSRHLSEALSYRSPLQT